jgi:hypothetical protein
MLRRQALGAWLGGAVALAAVEPARAEPARADAQHGAVVVAASAGAADAAKPLARAIYADAALRPPVDDATARVLAGDAAPQGAAGKIGELAELRASIEAERSDAARRRLLAAIGADVGAVAVIAVERTDAGVVARILHVTAAAYDGVALVATPAGAPEVPSFTWPTTAAATVRAAIAPAGSAAPAPTRPKSPPADRGSGSWLRSPWFWGPLVGVAAVGLTVLVLAETSDDDPNGTVHATGRLLP